MAEKRPEEQDSKQMVNIWEARQEAERVRNMVGTKIEERYQNIQLLRNFPDPENATEVQRLQEEIKGLYEGAANELNEGTRWAGVMREAVRAISRGEDYLFDNLSREERVDFITYVTEKFPKSYRIEGINVLDYGLYRVPSTDFFFHIDKPNSTVKFQKFSKDKAAPYHSKSEFSADWQVEAIEREEAKSAKK